MKNMDTIFAVLMMLLFTLVYGLLVFTQHLTMIESFIALGVYLMTMSTLRNQDQTGKVIMAQAILCDKCGKPAHILLDNEHYVSTASDLELTICGETVAKYDDLCDTCSDSLVEQLSGILGEAFMDSMVDTEEEEIQEAIEDGLEDVGSVDDFPEEFIESVEDNEQQDGEE